MKTQEKFVKNNRRQLLKMLAGGAASTPLLNAGLLTAGAGLSSSASAASPIKNVIFVFIPGGAPNGANYSITPTVVNNELVLKTCSAPLEAVKQECVFFAGTDMDGFAGHGLPQNALGGLTKAPKTIDLALGDLLGGTTPFSAIQLGAASGDTSISAVNNWTKSLAITDPARVFEILRSVQASDNPALQQQHKQLEINLKAVQQLQQQLGSFASARLQTNLDAIQQLQTEIASTSTLPGCDLQQQSWTAEAIYPNEYSKFTRLWELQSSNAITAIKCGLTHVVTLLMGGDQEDFIADGFTHSYAQIANSGLMAEYLRYRTYMTSRLANLIQQLKNTTDINGAPLLDSTLVVQVTNMGDTAINNSYDAPFMFAGGGSAIRRGQVVKGSLHTKVLDTVAQAMGVYGKIAPYSTTGPIAGVVA
jgi:hypothetical protein